MAPRERPCGRQELHASPAPPPAIGGGAGRALMGPTATGCGVGGAPIASAAIGGGRNPLPLGKLTPWRPVLPAN
eukprot:6931745-Alexandrium_andersonii.AAC.1